MSSLTAGFTSADITPPVGIAMAGYGSRDKVSQSVNDPLLAQALVLESGTTVSAIICTDLIGVDWEVVVAVREAAAAASGIPAENIMVCSSHTHWGPVISGEGYLPEYLRQTISPEYNQQLIQTLAEMTAQARQARVPAVAGYGEGFADGITFNRRPVGPDFKTQMRLTLEPKRAAIAAQEGNRLTQAWHKGEHKGPRLSHPLSELDGARVGPVDAGVCVLRLEKSDGQPLAGLVNFACHAVCGGGDFYAYSADYPGFARSAFEKLVGAPMLFAAGCSGDQVPRWRQDDARQRVGTSLGAEAGRVWLGIDDRQGELPLRVIHRDVKLPANERVPSISEAQAALAAKSGSDTSDAVYEREMLALAEEISSQPEGLPGEIWALSLGDLGIVGLPGEILTEIGLQIKQRSPFAHTMVVSLANGCLGYLSTDDAMHEGGYEPEWSPVGLGTERVLVETAVALLDELRG